MLERFEYENSNGDRLVFGEDGIFANMNDLRDYEWDYSTIGDRISSFRKGMAEKSVKLTFHGANKEECRRKRNDAYALFEYDIVKVQPGKIWIGDYYLECYVIGTANDEYLDSGRTMRTTIRVLTEDQNWKKDKDVEGLNSVIEGNNGFEPDHDFDIDYSLDYTVGRVNVESIEAGFTLTIKGYAENPIIVIAEHAYRLNMVIPAGTMVIIDSERRTIKLCDRYTDELSDCLYARDPDSYIFERIPYGESEVYKPHGVEIELTLHELRSEPVWT